MKRFVRLCFAYLFGMQYHLIGLYRLSRYCKIKVPIVGATMSVLIRHFMRFYTSCDISPLAIIESRVTFPHPTGVVVGDGVVIHSGAKIWQQVTIGSHGKLGQGMKYPVIGNNVRIYAKASVIGGVSIGDSAVIGAHSLVLNDVSAGQTAIGVPARIIAK